MLDREFTLEGKVGKIKKNVKKLQKTMHFFSFKISLVCEEIYEERCFFLKINYI